MPFYHPVPLRQLADVTPLLKKGGEMFDIKYLNFLLLNKSLPRDAARRSGEEYP